MDKKTVAKKIRGKKKTSNQFEYSGLDPEARIRYEMMRDHGSSHKQANTFLKKNDYG